MISRRKEARHAWYLRGRDLKNSHWAFGVDNVGVALFYSTYKYVHTVPVRVVCNLTVCDCSSYDRVLWSIVTEVPPCIDACAVLV